MIELRYKGLNEAISKLRNTLSMMPVTCTNATELAANHLVEFIRQATGLSEYSESLEVVVDYGRMRSLIAPSPEWISDEELRTDATYMWRNFKCPYYKYLTEEELREIPREERLEEIVAMAMPHLSDLVYDFLSRRLIQ